jgi:hypothetical protein
MAVGAVETGLIVTILGLLFMHGQAYYSPGVCTAAIERKTLFVFLCIPTRFMIAMFAPFIPRELFLLPAMGFLWKYIQHKKEDQGAFGGKIWWHRMRLVHSALYFLAYLYPQDARVILLSDVVLALLAAP